MTRYFFRHSHTFRDTNTIDPVSEVQNDSLYLLNTMIKYILGVGEQSFAEEVAIRDNSFRSVSQRDDSCTRRHFE
jgi:hypothetical protein